MINHLSAGTTARVGAPRFHTGIFKSELEQAALETAEEVVARHTASGPSRGLRAAFTLQSLRTGLPLLAGDMMATGTGLLCAAMAVNLIRGVILPAGIVPAGIWIQAPVLMVLQAMMMFVHQMYPGAGIGPVAELRGIVRSTLLSVVCLAAMNLILGQLPTIEMLTFIVAAVIVSALALAGRSILRKLLARTSWWGIGILLIGDRTDCISKHRQLKRRRSGGLIPAGYVCEASDLDEITAGDQRLLGRIYEAPTVALTHAAPVAGLVTASSDAKQYDRLAFQFPAVVGIDRQIAVSDGVDTSGLPQVFTTRTQMPFVRFLPRIIKRALDLAICIPGLLVLAIPMGIIAVAIKYFSPGPVIYASRRIGQHGKEFKMWKFRSMVPDADQVLQAKLDADPEARREWELNSKLKSDPRIIPGIGDAIRRWSLDELPQLWNVLVGEMSLVGPRPVPPDEIVRYQKHYYEYTQMWPGITGLWQVSGRSDTTFDTRVFLVRHYARNWSPWLDFWVLLNTPAVVVSKSGAY